jgi:general secretion pathway protein B
MSTILDALRRAEAERATPPGTSLPPLGPVPPAALPRRNSSAPLLVAAAVLLALGAAGLYAWMPTAPAPAPAPKPAPAPVAATPAPLPAPAALLQTPGARALPQPEASPAPPAPPPRAEASAPARLPRLAELPAALRQQLPPLQLSGSMHSPDARLRSLILNGQLYREGDLIAPGLKLEEIGPRSARLRFREQAFELDY